MQEHIEFNGIKYISLKRAAEEIDLSRDYMARLCKKNAVDARRLDSGWYVDPVSIRAYLRAQEHAREFRRKKLAEDRAREYKKKSTVHIDKSESSPSQAVLVPVVSYATDAHQRMRSALEKQSAVAFSVISESGRMPGLLQAATELPARALSQMPTHVISPTLDLLHRVVALTSAFVLVFGTYSLFDRSYAHTAYESVQGSLRFAADLGRHTASLASRTEDSTQMALTRLSQDPSDTLSGIGRGLRVAYESVGSLASDLTPATGSSVAAVASATSVSNDSDVAPVTTNAITQLAAAAGGASESTPGDSQVSTQPIAIAVPFTGTAVSYGDLIAYNAQASAYTLTTVSNDPDLFGVVIEDPALLFKPDGGSDISVARSGAALLNVTLENGVIAAGDPLTSSSIPGKARKAEIGEHVIATAKEAFSEGGVLLETPNGSKLASGTISVNVSTVSAGAAQAAQQSSCTTLSCRLSNSIDTQIVRTLVRYLLSGIIAALTLTLAFKSFMSDANYGVISIGRNPRAKSSIQSLVLFNAILALAIASAGLFAAMVVLFAG